MFGEYEGRYFAWGEYKVSVSFHVSRFVFFVVGVGADEVFVGSQTRFCWVCVAFCLAS